jgi:hypothetical protein
MTGRLAWMIHVHAHVLTQANGALLAVRDIGNRQECALFAFGQFGENSFDNE